MFSRLVDQLRKNKLMEWMLYGFAFLLLFAVFLGNRLFGIPIAQLMRDTTSLAEVAPWTGFVSNIGVLFWCATMTICFATAAVSQQHLESKHYLGFLLTSGFLTAFLMLDDFFVLHESFRDYLGFPERAFYGLYLIFFTGYLIRYGRFILKTDFAFLLLAFCFLGASLGLDNFQNDIVIYVPYPYYYLLEDGLKLIGIVSWFGYFTTFFLTVVKNNSSP